MRTLVALSGLLLVACGATSSEGASPVEGRRFVPSKDGVAIAYAARGHGSPALVFIHGGFADASFWRFQVAGLEDDHRVVTMDLAGHGDSGMDRIRWTLEAFGDDVEAVVRVLDLDHVVLVGNSMGGPVALEAARRIPERVLGVVGVDTFHSADRRIDPKAWSARIESLEADFDGAMAGMVRSLFHPDADSALVAQVSRRMRATRPEIAVEILEGFAGYDLGAAMRAAQVPIRCINGDLYPTDLEANRRACPRFDAIVMEHAGHFPMLERPAEFNRHLRRLVASLSQRGAMVIAGPRK